MNTVSFWSLVVFSSFCAIDSLSADTIGPPDSRTWNEVTADFAAAGSRHPNAGTADGLRLKELDAERAAAFLIPFLDEDRPEEMRIKAISALGWASISHGIPKLVAIAENPDEKEEIRVRALNPGLRYMNDVRAVRVACVLIANASERIRSAASCTLSQHGTDEAVEALQSRLRAGDEPLDATLIMCIRASKHKRAGKMVFDSIAFDRVRNREKPLRAYALTMYEYEVPEALGNMREIVLAQHTDHKLVTSDHELATFYAIRYFGIFPREDVVPSLVNFIERRYTMWRGDNALKNTIAQFLESPKISAASKKRITASIPGGSPRD